MIVLKCDRCGTIFDVPSDMDDEFCFPARRGDTWPGSVFLNVRGNPSLSIRGDFCVACLAEVGKLFGPCETTRR